MDDEVEKQALAHLSPVGADEASEAEPLDCVVPFAEAQADTRGQGRIRGVGGQDQLKRDGHVVRAKSGGTGGHRKHPRFS